MKTYTITCHHVFNYGASLQAYALQRYLKNKGIDNKIIDYMPDYLAWHYHFSWWISKRGSHYSLLKKIFLLRFLYVTRRYLRDLKSWKRRDAFDRFKNNYLALTQICRTLEEINAYVSDANVLIAGSDQIWNSYSLENGLDRAFYLDFGPEEAVKISYAASFGVNEVKEKDRRFVIDMLKNFDHISVREEKGCKLLEKLGFNGTVVVDPVFLLDNKEWESLSGNITLSAPYILIYSIGDISDPMFSMIRQIQDKTGFKAVCVRSNRHISGIEEITDAGPAEFVSLIKNASFVISNSFHATAFSLIFEKEFYSYPYGSKSSERIVSLLKGAKIEDRYDVRDYDDKVKLDYNCINECVAILRENSTRWLDAYVNCNYDKQK